VRLRPRRLLPPLALLAAAGLLPLLLRAADTEQRRYALLVGVKSYKKDQFRPLLYTETDVNALAEVFKGAGYKRVVLLTQEAAKADVDLLPTAANIREQLKSLLKDRTASHTVVVAFSGHGVQFKDEQEHFFCPMDADLTRRATLISLKEVYDELRKCDARVKLLLVDACRNDPLAKKPTRALEKVKLESRTRPQRLRPPGGVREHQQVPGGVGVLEGRGGVLREAVSSGRREARWTRVPLADGGGVGICLSGRGIYKTLPLRDQYLLPLVHPGELQRQLPLRRGRQGPVAGAPVRGR
jgi:hypothetical protein